MLVALLACGRVDAPDRPADAAEADAPESDAPVAPCAMPAGLAARWRGEMTLEDDLGRYDGAAVGQVAYVPGKHGSAFALNGIDTLISIADQADSLWPSGSFSVEAWVKTSSLPGIARLISKYECGGTCPTSPSITFASWDLEINAAGNPRFSVRSTPNQNVTAIDTVHVISDGAWHHVVGVRDIQAKQLLLYLDGALAAVSATLTDGQLAALDDMDGELDPVTIGGSRVANAARYIDHLHGAIDEIAYFSAALSADDVQAIYAAPEGECRDARAREAARRR